jgi:hypothetical protein
MLPCRSTRALVGSARLSLLLILLIALLASAGAVFAEKDKGKGKPGKKKKNVAGATASASPGEQSLTNIPLPIGHEAKGLVLPDFDMEGHLRGKFIASTARRIDEEHIQFQDLKITTFTPESQVDLQIDMQTSVFDLKTKILSSKERAMVKRADFNIVGDAIQFDTNTRTGRMVGNVKMIITSQSQLIQQPKE